MSKFITTYKFSPRGFNPLFWHLLPLLRDEGIRHILIEGGSGAAKTYTICQALLIDGFEHEYSTMVFRRQLVDVQDSVYATFKVAANGLGLDYYTYQQHLFKGKDDKSHIRFRGLDDEENIKGIERFNVVYFNEFSQFEEHLFDQANLRLRGRTNQKIICDWNPISSKLWQYERYIDTQTWRDLPLAMQGYTHSTLSEGFAFKRINAAGNTVWIKVTYRDNYWIVGRPGGGGNIDTHTLDTFERMRIQKPNLYRIYANGERGIVRTGGEFWTQFNELTHTCDLELARTPIHVAVDNNLNPYVAIAIWQVDAEQRRLNQCAELPCYSPDNSARKAAKRLIAWMRRINYRDVIYLRGDASANNRSTIDDNNASFFDKFISTLEDEGYHVVNCVERSNPRVALSGEFINELYECGFEGWEIRIDRSCKVSIDDYIMAKKDVNGGILKKRITNTATGQTYEEHGHYSDTKRYLVCGVLADEFERYGNRSGSGIVYV